jgi:hypothetical protein
MAIRRLVAAGERSPTRAHRALKEEGLFENGNEVSVKTIARRLRYFSGKYDDSGPWSLADSDPDDAHLVLEVLDRQMNGSPYQSWPTRALAQWIIRVRKAAPDMLWSWALSVAKAYWQQELRGKDTRYLDLLLAHKTYLAGSNEDFFRAVRCARPILGDPDVLVWILFDWEVLSYYEDPDGSLGVDASDLTGPCDYNPRVLKAWQEY